MAVSLIHVQCSDGTPSRRVRVVLGFAAGNTREVYPNRGEAVVDHTSVGMACVYVSGKAYHTFHAPGRTSVTVRAWPEQPGVAAEAVVLRRDERPARGAEVTGEARTEGRAFERGDGTPEAG